MAKIAKIETNLAKLGFTPELVSLLLNAGKQAIFLGNKVLEYCLKNNIPLNEFCNNSFNINIINAAINQIATFKNSNNGNIEPIKQLELQQLAYLSNYLQLNYNELNQIVIDYRDANGLGLYWAYLGYSVCSHKEESNRMSNCGYDGGCYIFSLRKFSGNGMNESLVTLSVFSDDDGLKISQVKSYGNSSLAKKYIPYFLDICKELNLSYEEKFSIEMGIYRENATCEPEYVTKIDLENLIKFGGNPSGLKYVVNNFNYKFLIINDSYQGNDFLNLVCAVNLNLIDRHEFINIVKNNDLYIEFDGIYEFAYCERNFLNSVIFDLIDRTMNVAFFIFNTDKTKRILGINDIDFFNDLTEQQTKIVIDDLLSNYDNDYRKNFIFQKIDDYNEITNRFFVEFIKSSKLFSDSCWM